MTDSLDDGGRVRGVVVQTDVVVVPETLEERSMKGEIECRTHDLLQDVQYATGTGVTEKTLT